MKQSHTGYIALARATDLPLYHKQQGRCTLSAQLHHLRWLFDHLALLVLLSDNIESTLKTVELCGGEISKPIFSFPGGRRFHFVEPSGNELAVWEKLCI